MPQLACTYARCRTEPAFVGSALRDHRRREIELALVCLLPPQACDLHGAGIGPLVHHKGQLISHGHEGQWWAPLVVDLALRGLVLRTPLPIPRPDHPDPDEVYPVSRVDPPVLPSWGGLNAGDRVACPLKRIGDELL